MVAKVAIMLLRLAFCISMVQQHLIVMGNISHRYIYFYINLSKFQIMNNVCSYGTVRGKSSLRACTVNVEIISKSLQPKKSFVLYFSPHSWSFEKDLVGFLVA